MHFFGAALFWCSTTLVHHAASHHARTPMDWVGVTGLGRCDWTG